MQCEQMLVIFTPNNVDWLRIPQDKHTNKWTYHHIEKRCDGGPASISNGAILTEIAHKYVHYLEFHNYEAYQELNALFKELNSTLQAPTDAYYERLDDIIEKYHLDPNCCPIRTEKRKHKNKTSAHTKKKNKRKR